MITGAVGDILAVFRAGEETNLSDAHLEIGWNRGQQ